MGTADRGITQQEMLLAIAMSEYYEKTHVLFIPPGTHYTNMLQVVVRKKLAYRFSPSFYKLTPKGFLKLRTLNAEKFKEADKEIEEFINKL